MVNAGLTRPEESEINVPSSIDSLKDKFKTLSVLSNQCCIYKVPERLRKINAEAYTPFRVSIGPIHHGEEPLKPMEEHKLRYLQDFEERNGSHNILEEFLEFIKENEKRIRECYMETFPKIKSKEFVEIILVDATFIIEVLLRQYYPNLIPENDRIYRKPWLISDIIRDVLLLENQLPFFVLNHLYGKTMQHQYSCPPSFYRLAIDFFVKSSIIKHQPGEIDNTKVEHLIDFLRSCHRPNPIRSQSTQQQNGTDKKLASIRSATELHEAGVKFVKGSSENLFDIKFSNGVLEIPHTEITDFTECCLRNLLAFERCHYERDYIVDYVMFMDGLINTSGDVELLVRKGIIESWLGDNKDVSILFNKLGKEIDTDFNDFHFSQISKDLKDYCEMRRHNWKATLRHDYCSSPWRVLSIVAAFVLLLLTLIQTVCSVMSARAGK